MQTNKVSCVAALRSFSRFYTKLLALLERHLPETTVTLSEARILYEIGHRVPCTASDISNALNVDPGYVSRLLKGFEKEGLIRKERSPHDARALSLTLSEKGKVLLRELEAASERQAAKLLAPLDDRKREALTDHLDAIQRLLTSPQDAPRPRVRPCRPGELSYLAYLHTDVYRREYGLDEDFETYVLRSMVEYREKSTEGSEVWVVEDGSKIVGGIGIVRIDEATAQLRWFLLLPEYRGLGLGRELVQTSLDFCRNQGYDHVFLWTVSDLTAARSLYERFGFQSVETAEHDIWGKHLVEERWELALAG